MKKMFGHHKKRSESTRTPGSPPNMQGMDQSYGKSKDNPPNYEGREHVKYKDPGYSRHNIRHPEDEPHMRSNVSREETHEMEDNYHMDVPDQTHHTLEKKLLRARMKMDDPDQEEPDRLRGNMVHNVGADGVVDTTGEEEMGPNEMQSSMPKEHRKRMIAAVTKRKMNKGN